MNYKEAIKVLNAHKKWLRGTGHKYVSFDATKEGALQSLYDAIDVLSDLSKVLMTKEEFATLVEAASITWANGKLNSAHKQAKKVATKIMMRILPDILVKENEEAKVKA